LRRSQYASRFRWKVHFYVTIFESLLAFAMMIGSFVGYRIDAGIWCIILIGVLSLSAWLISSHAPELPHGINNDKDFDYLQGSHSYSAIGGYSNDRSVFGGRVRRIDSNDDGTPIWWPSCMQTRPWSQTCWVLLVRISRVVVWVFLIFVCTGIWTQAVGWVRFTPR
jgi:hypothetical protein